VPLVNGAGLAGFIRVSSRVDGQVVYDHFHVIVRSARLSSP
jgi:hypothetical protein